jgi:hypothetical protein
MTSQRCPAATAGMGGFGTSWSSDPHEEMAAVVMVQRLFDQAVVDLHADFWTLAYQAIDD